MMAVVAVTAVLIWLAITSLVFLAAIVDDTYYPAKKKMAKTWDAGPAPKVDVDLFAGYIDVIQSADGRVSAVITTSAVFKNSQAGADSAVNGIVITADHEGDTIRIRATNPGNLRAFNLQTDVELCVPPGASLELLTGHGYVHIGQCLGGPNGNEWTSAPVALKSVKARDLGGIYTGMDAEILSNPSSPATVLDLESRRGSIRIKGDNLLIKAKAGAGGIEYAGRPAPGMHSFVTGPYVSHGDGNWRLARGIKLVVPRDMAFEVDAISARDKVRSRFPLTSAASQKPGILKGRIGGDPKVKLELKSDDGAIEILQDARETQKPGVGTPVSSHRLNHR
jgi:hypothetical protein